MLSVNVFDRKPQHIYRSLIGARIHSYGEYNTYNVWTMHPSSETSCHQADSFNQPSALEDVCLTCVEVYTTPV